MISSRSIVSTRHSTRSCAPSIGHSKAGPSTIASAAKRSKLLPPTEDKTVQCIVETGIRGSLAMLAASALQLDVFSHVHAQLGDALTGLTIAAPVLGAEAALLLLYSTLTAHSSQQQQQQPQPAAAAGPGTASTVTPALLCAMDSVYLHNIRYSLLGAASPAARLALEAGAQLSEELLARGALLGCASTWLASRFLEASMCGGLDPSPLSTLMLSSTTATSSAAAATAAELLPCGTAPQWLAAAGLCAIMCSRFVVHSKGKAAATRSAREAAAAEAAARRAVLRYEPLAVQQAAAAAAGAEGVGSEMDAEAAASLAAAEAEAVESLAHVWLGARFVLGQACMFGAFIATDNLLASFVAGLAMTVVSSACTEQYLQRATSTTA